MEFLSAYGVAIIIFVARVCDVSLGTLRIVFVSRGMRAKAALLGFVEVLIWIVVIAQLIQHLNNWANYVAYAGGFALGTFIGITLENKLKVGTVMIRVVTNGNADELINRLKKANVMLTCLDAQGAMGPVKIIFTVTKRKRWKEIVNIIESFDSAAFYSIEDVKHTNSSGIDRGFRWSLPTGPFDRLLRVRKGI